MGTCSQTIRIGDRDGGGYYNEMTGEYHILGTRGYEVCIFEGIGSGSSPESGPQSPTTPTTRCPIVPTVPPGQDVNSNIRTAAKHKARQSFGLEHEYDSLKNVQALSSSIGWFYETVKYGARWDYKTQNPPGLKTFVDGGNFNFGATGRAVGFSRDELLWGAGIAQLAYDISKLRWPQGIETRFDNADDAAPITAGMDYYDNGCY